jgi:hypothetical protein
MGQQYALQANIPKFNLIPCAITPFILHDRTLEAFFQTATSTCHCMRAGVSSGWNSFSCPIQFVWQQHAFAFSLLVGSPYNHLSHIPSATATNWLPKQHKSDGSGNGTSVSTSRRALQCSSLRLVGASWHPDQFGSLGSRCSGSMLPVT